MYHISQSNPFPFVVRWRVYDRDGSYIASFKDFDKADKYVGFLAACDCLDSICIKQWSKT